MKSLPSRPRKFINFLLPVFLTGYLFLLLFPQLVFGHKLTYRSFTVYSHAPAGRQLYGILDKAEALLQHSELTDKKPAKYCILLCGGFTEFAFFAPTQFRAFASYNPVTGNILIANPEVALNRARRNGAEHKVRTLSGVIAHEATHALIRNAFGFTKHLQIASWKKEGYCDHIARESSFKTENGMELLCKSQPDPAPSFQYFKYRLYVTWLLHYRQLTFKEVAGGKFDLNELEQAVKQEYCPEKSTLPLL